MNFYKLLQLILGVILLTLYNCTKDETKTQSAIPYVEVNVRINVNDPIYSKVKNVGGWTYVNGGSRGLILYRESVEIFKAYDRHCTFDPIEVCSTLDMDANLLQANDFDCCKSIFSILNGTIIQGPAIQPLLQYNTSFDGTFVTIVN